MLPKLHGPVSARRRSCHSCIKGKHNMCDCRKDRSAQEGEEGDRERERKRETDRQTDRPAGRVGGRTGERTDRPTGSAGRQNKFALPFVFTTSPRPKRDLEKARFRVRGAVFGSGAWHVLDAVVSSWGHVCDKIVWQGCSTRWPA